MHGGYVDPDFIYGLIAGVVIGSALLWLIRRKRGA
jgi:gas vesicle protein